MDIAEVQAETITLAGGSRTDNASGADSVGFEIETAVRPTRGLEILVGASYAYATFSDYPNAPTAEGGTADATGKRLPLASLYTLSGAVQYRRYVDIWTALVGRIDYVYKGPMYYDPHNLLREPPHGVLNARLGLEGEHWALFLWAKNLFDKKYRVLGYDLGPPSGRFGFAAPPRTFGLQMRLRL